MDLDRQFAGLGLPDDLTEIGLTGAPVPGAEAAERVRQRVLSGVGESRRPTRRRRRWPWAAAAAVLVLAIAMPSGWMQGLVRLVPGFGLTEQGSVELALARPVKVLANGDTIYVTGLLATRRGTTLTVAISGPDAESPPSDLRLEDGSNVYRTSGGSWASGTGSAGRAPLGNGVYGFPALSPSTKHLTLVLPLHPAVKVRLWLADAGSLATIRQLPHAALHGVTVGASLVPGSSGALFDVMSMRTPSGTSAQAFGSWNAPVRLIVDGRALRIHEVPSFDGPIRLYTGSPIAPGNHSAEVVVPTVHLTVDATPSVRILVPTSGSLALNQTVSVGPASVRFTRVQRLKRNRIRVTVQQTGAARLEAPFLPLNYSGGSVAHLDARGGVQWFTIQVPQGALWVDLRAVDPSVVMVGPWRIEVPVLAAK